MAKQSSNLIYIYRKTELPVESYCLIWGNRVIIPFHLRNKILTELHENHPGIVRMKALAHSYVWWTGKHLPKHLHIYGKKQLLLG